MYFRRVYLKHHSNEKSLVELPIATRDGIFLAHYSPKGLAELDFPHRDGLVAPEQNKSVGQTGGRSQEPRALRKNKFRCKFSAGIASRPMR